MNTQWMINTHGDPLGTVRKFVDTIWEQRDLNGMLVPLNGGQESSTTPQLIDDPHMLDQVNPFKPLMIVNAARMLPAYIGEHPDDQIGALLRPCEMRALIEMVKHDSFNTDKLTSICVDCLGTLPLEDYQWRAQRKGHSDNLTDEALQFARQGGILAYRYRSACQMCKSPEATRADININVLGLPVRQQILVQARDAAAARDFRLEEITDCQADSAMVEQHDRIMFKLSERHQHTMQRLFETLADYLPQDVEALVAQLDNCGECQACMDICPICSVDHPQRGVGGHYIRADVMRWLVSCAGCGMCEQSCPNHLPLSSIFGYIREQLGQQWEYTPGRSADDPLPLM